MQETALIFRVCNKCGQEKPIMEFPPDKKCSLGRRRTCRVCERERRAAYDEANREKLTEAHRQWCKKNKEHLSEYAQKYQNDRRGHIAEVKKQYRQKKKALVKSWLRQWRKDNPEKSKEYNRRRRAIKLGNGHSPYRDIDIFIRDAWTCAICGGSINQSLQWPDPMSASVDHVIPISKGGIDAPENLQASHLRCNQSKRDRIPELKLRAS